MARCFLGLFLACGAVGLPAAGRDPLEARQQRTLAPVGPFEVRGSRLLDSYGRPFLIRGTELPEFRADTVEFETRSGGEFGPYSATSLAAIRLRFNFNAVRVPVAPGADLDELERLVRRAHRFELLVILAGGGAPAASRFKDDRNLIFEAGSAGELEAIRAAGARQPVAVDGDVETRDNNVLRGAAPGFPEISTEAGRRAALGELGGAVLVRWDLDLGEGPACASIPRDPSAAAAIVEANLDYFDRRGISWIVSRFVPGKLIRDLSLHDATTLENGWTCGQPASPPAGLGRIVQGHMRAADPRGLFVVGASGGIEVARGSAAIAYGPVMAERDARAATGPLPQTLAHIGVEVTDAAGVVRPAGLLWASQGWGQVNFVVPEDAAEGPARMTIVRADGSRLSANLTITATAPGFWTDVSCRGPAAGYALYTLPDGSTEQATLSSCRDGRCEPVEVRMGGAPVRLRLDASGFRFARSAGEIEVTIGGVRVPVVSYGPSAVPGKDQLTVEVPAELRGLGDADLASRVYGRASNVVRVRIGS